MCCGPQMCPAIRWHDTVPRAAHRRYVSDLNSQPVLPCLRLSAEVCVSLQKSSTNAPQLEAGLWIRQSLCCLSLDGFSRKIAWNIIQISGNEVCVLSTWWFSPAKSLWNDSVLQLGNYCLFFSEYSFLRLFLVCDGFFKIIFFLSGAFDYPQYKKLNCIQK